MTADDCDILAGDSDLVVNDCRILADDGDNLADDCDISVDERDILADDCDTFRDECVITDEDLCSSYFWLFISKEQSNITKYKTNYLNHEVSSSTQLLVYYCY